MQSALESALAELVLGRGIELDDEAAVEAWLERHGVSGADARRIRDREIRRLGVYRELVRNTLRGALRIAIPRTIARLGDVFEEYFGRFTEAGRPTTRYLRAVIGEFLDFCEPHWAQDPRVMPYAHELARHEALHIEVGSTEPLEAPRELGELGIEARLLFTEASRLVHYTYAVHRLRDDLDDRSDPDPTPVDLFVYRSPAHEVRYLELSPAAAAILRRLLRGETLGASLRESAAELGVALDAPMIRGTAELLADLAERGALLGAGESEAATP